MLRYRGMKTPITPGSMYKPFHVELPPPYLPAHCIFRQTQKRLRQGLAAEIPSPRVLFFAESDHAIYQDGVGDHGPGRRKKYVVTFQFYQDEKKGTHLAVGGKPEGRVCIIKEPWYELMTDGSYGL